MTGGEVPPLPNKALGSQLTKFPTEWPARPSRSHTAFHCDVPATGSAFASFHRAHAGLMRSSTTWRNTGPHLLRRQLRFRWPVAQRPQPPAGKAIAELLPEAVVRANVICCARSRLFARTAELNSPVDMALVLNHPCNFASRLQLGETRLGDPVFQDSIGVVEGDSILHWKTLPALNAAGKSFSRIPTLVIPLVRESRRVRFALAYRTKPSM